MKKTFRKGISLVMVLCILLGGINFAYANPSDVIKFGSPLLERAVRLKINKPGGDILRSDVEKITSLDVWGDNQTSAANLRGIENLTGLKKLRLQDCTISDITLLSNLTNLEELVLDGNNISNISPLESLKSLRYLDLRNNKISNLNGISGLVNLEALNLKDNQIIDITQLKDLTKLKELDMNNNLVRDISSLSGLSYIRKLSLENNQISSISSLSNKRDLKYLNLGKNSISDISALKSSTGMIWLELGGNNIKDIGYISSMAGLKLLSLSNNGISNIDSLKEIRGLLYLDLEGNKINNVDLLSNMKGLQYMNLNNNLIDNINLFFNENNQFIFNGINSPKYNINIVIQWNNSDSMSNLPNVGMYDIQGQEPLRLKNNKISDRRIKRYKPVLDKHLNMNFNFGSQTPVDPVIKNKRIDGSNRYETAAKIAKQLYPNGVDTVIIARGDTINGTPQIADALAASLLAKSENAPILLTASKSLSSSTKQAIKDLGAKNAIVVGGKTTITDNVIKDLGISATRVFGDDRYGTAEAIAYKSNTKSKTAYIVDGYALADALASGPLASETGNPILLVKKNSVPTETKNAINKLGIENIYIIGGKSVVSDKIATELKGISGVKSVNRIGGNDRYETSALVAEKFWNSNEDIMFANGLSMVDAVSASTLRKPLLFVSQRSVRPEVQKYIIGAKSYTLIGGKTVIPESIKNQIIDGILY